MTSRVMPLWCAAMACSLGCADDPLDAESLEDCPATVTISVGAGTTPSFSWQPTCRLFFVNVEPALSGTDLWTIISLGQNGIAPPVVYGQVPSGATELTRPKSDWVKVVTWSEKPSSTEAS
jgi:hypothetical protein